MPGGVGAHPSAGIEVFAQGVTRRAFMATSAATTLTALTLSPVARAHVTAKVIEQLSAKSVTGDLFSQMVCGLSYKVTKLIDSNPDLNLLTYVAQLYETQGMGTAGLTITPLDTLRAALGDNPRIADVMPGVNCNEVTLAELLARVMTPGILQRTGSSIREDIAILASRYHLPDFLNGLLDDGFKLQDVMALDGGISQDSEVMQFFTSPEHYIVKKILDTASLGDLSLTISVPAPVDKSETFVLRDTAGQFEDKVLELVCGGSSLLDALFGPQFEMAKLFVGALAEHGLLELGGLSQFGSNLLGTPLGSIDLPDMIGDSVFTAVQSPSDAAQAVMEQIAAAQEKLDGLLDYLEGLYSRFSALPEDVVNLVPGLGYIVTDAAGVFESIAKQILSEISAAESLAQQLAGQILALQAKLATLVLSAEDLPIVSDAIDATKDVVSDPLGGVASAVQAFQDNVPGLAQIEPELFKTFVNNTIGELNGFMDDHKDLLVGGLTMAAYSSLKANAIFMILSREQIKSILKYGLRIEPEEYALLEVAKLYGRWNGYTAIDNLDKLSFAQLNKRVNDKIEPVVSVLKEVRDTVGTVLADPQYGTISDSVARVISHHLFNASPLYQNRLTVYGASPDTRISDLIGRADFAPVLTAPVTAATFTRDATVTAIGTQVAELLIERAQDEPLVANSIGVAAPFTLATESLHQVIANMAEQAIRQALIDVVTNYVVTLIQNAFTSLDVDLSQYEDLNQEMLDEEREATLQDRAIVVAARISLDVASVGITDLVGAAVFVVLAQQIRSVVEQLVGEIFDIVVSTKAMVSES